MKRGLKLLVALFVLGACAVFASALFGGLMDDRAFTSEAVGKAH